MTTIDKIIAFCNTPRTTKEIADYLGLHKDTIYRNLNTLRRNNVLEKRGDGRCRVEPARFVITRKAPKATESTEDYENLVITHAHNPFGLRT